MSGVGSVVISLLERLDRHTKAICAVDTRLKMLEMKEEENQRKAQRKESGGLDLLMKIVERIEGIEERLYPETRDKMIQTESEETEEKMVQVGVETKTVASGTADRNFGSCSTQREPSTVTQEDKADTRTRSSLLPSTFKSPEKLIDDEETFHSAESDVEETPQKIPKVLREFPCLIASIQVTESRTALHPQPRKPQVASAKTVPAPSASTKQRSFEVLASKTKPKPISIQNNQNEVGELKPWRTCERPFRILSKKKRAALKPADRLARRVMFYLNVCTCKRLFAKELVDDFIAAGDVLAYDQTFADIFYRSLNDHKRVRIYADLAKEILKECVHRNSSKMIFRYVLDSLCYNISEGIAAHKDYLKGALGHKNTLAPNQVHTLSKKTKEVAKERLEFMEKCQKQLLVNAMCFLGELQKHFLAKDTKLLDAFKKMLASFDKNAVSFARKILNRLYRISEEKLWSFDKSYAEEEENSGEPL
ncbi:hypothetical protein QR680_007717 [Steinernema hermaphroditum]|uniref:Uncharacterized protein n=1 Tax=Steinernema hermaphroditum TaxID=289476 RepID=A0AA39IGI0_9BILA|nr:hypothetical protein QR680_007717 [Steinernema hermaphroditum]